MAARILDGKQVSRDVREGLRPRVEALRERAGRPPGLAAVLVGDDPASRVYVRNKEKACAAIGMAGAVHHLPGETPEADLLALVDRLNADEAVHGILVQLPLPPQIDPDRVIARVDPVKDVDGFHPENLGRLAAGRPRHVPCTPLGVRELLRASGIPTRGREVVVIGRSTTVGKPFAMLMMLKGEQGDATVTVCHSASRDIPAIARRAEVLVAAAGRPHLVRADWVRPGAVVVDVGIHRGDDGKLLGDVAFDEVAEVASWISPVPGGVGPMTIAMLLSNTVAAAEALSP